MECFTPSQVKQMLGVKQTIVYELFNSKEFPSFKIRGSWRVKRDDLEAWIEKQKKQKSL